MKTYLPAIVLSILILHYQHAAARSEAAKLSRPNSLAFIENKGQVTDQEHRQRRDIDYKLSTRGMDIFIGSGTLHYQFSKQGSALGSIAASRNVKNRRNTNI